MSDINDNDKNHGKEAVDEKIPTSKEMTEAKLDLLDKLKAGDEDLRAIAIDALINNDDFWDNIFSLGAVKNFSPDSFVNDGIDIGVHVFAGIAGEVYDLAASA